MIRRLQTAVLALALFAAWAAPASAATPDPIDPRFDPSRLVTPPLRPIPRVTPERYVLPNGLVVYLLENHDLPVVRGTAYVRTSVAWIPADRTGLNAIAGRAMRAGGTAAHPGDALDDRLAAIGASIGTRIGGDVASADFDCLSDDLDEVVGLWAELMREPAFPEDKVELARVALRRQIAARNDEMFSVLFRIAPQAIYGADSPYARQPEYATVEAVTRADCVDLHRKVFEPSRMIVALYGDFRSADLKRRLATSLGAWKGAGIALPPDPPLPADPQPRLVFAPKDDVTQSGIVVAHLGFRADDPDYPAMDVYQTALGGGFQSRLFNRIRTERGLAYATAANAGEGYLRPGVFLAIALTRSDSTFVAHDLLREEVARSVAQPFSDDELATARNSLLNGLVFQYERPSDVLDRAAYLELLGYPADFLQRYQKGVQEATALSVLAAARRKVHPDRLVTVLVGREADFDRPLDAAGLPVERIDITIPPPPSKHADAAGAASPGALARGRAWLAGAAGLAGGSPAWQAVRALHSEGSATVTMQGQSAQVTTRTDWVFPAHSRVAQKLPFGELTQGTDGRAGWVSMAGQVRDEPRVVASVAEQWERSLFHLFGSADSLEVRAGDEPASVAGASYRVAYVTGDRVRDWELYFADDGSLAGMGYQADGPQGPAHQVVLYSDWRPVGAVRYPFGQRILVGGEPFVEGTATVVELDPAIDASTFDKPAAGPAGP